MTGPEQPSLDRPLLPGYFYIHVASVYSGSSSCFNFPHPKGETSIAQSLHGRGGGRAAVPARGQNLLL